MMLRAMVIRVPHKEVQRLQLIGLVLPAMHIYLMVPQVISQQLRKSLLQGHRYLLLICGSTQQPRVVNLLVLVVRKQVVVAAMIARYT